MTRRRRIGALVGLIAVALLAGRVLAVLYAQHAWYDALGAGSVWRERTGHSIILYFVLAVVAGAFAAVNVAAMRNSVMSLSLPRRLANVEFGEEVPPRYMNGAAVVLSLLVATVMGLLGPSWLTFATAASGLRFGEEDPYLGRDLGFYVGWLPFERELYGWTLLLTVLVTGMVVALYALTPGLRLIRGRLSVSPHVRRHMSLLGALALLLIAWRYRLDSYDLLIHGSGPDGAFGYVDHKWTSPSYLILSIVTVAAAALVAAAGWAGQVRTSFMAITGVIVLSLATIRLVPLAMRQAPNAGVQRARNSPYVATRDAYTRRAFPADTASVGEPDATTPGIERADTDAIDALLARQEEKVNFYPGARGTVVVGDSSGSIAAPSLSGKLSRLAHAWAGQELSLLAEPLPSGARIVTVRDVRERIATLVPVLAQGAAVAPLFRADTLYWSVPVFVASPSYPLSARRRLEGEMRGYFRRAGTAVVHSRTGRVTVFSVAPPDPIAAAWIRRHPGIFLRQDRSWLGELGSTPPTAARQAGSSGIPASDSSFRVQVTALHNVMRAALARGDLAAFGTAFDSLGMLVTRQRR